MGYYPSQDWDRYCAEQDAKAAWEWGYSLSQFIAQVEPTWNADVMLDPDNSHFGEEEILWGDGLKVAIPLNIASEPDTIGTCIRTLRAMAIEFRIRSLSMGGDPDSEGFAIFRYHFANKEPWRIVPGTQTANRQALEDYLEFLGSDEVEWGYDYLGIIDADGETDDAP